MKVIDVHTHHLGHQWFQLLREHGGARYAVRRTDVGDQVSIGGAPFLFPRPAHFSFDERVARMDEAGVDVAICSLTCPNVYWGGEKISSEAARVSNDEMAQGQAAYPDRIRWLASLPWEYPDAAVSELERACRNGAVGVMVLANINEESLTAQRFAPIWEAIDERSLPVLLHPTAPPGVTAADMTVYNLIASVGFMHDTTLAVTRMIYDGFFDRYPNLKLIAAHAGGSLPYLAGRLDRYYDMFPSICAAQAKLRPSEYLKRIFYDAATYGEESLKLCLETVGSGQVMYGSDYPHRIGDMTGLLSQLDALDPDTRERVRGATARRVFSLE